MDNFTTVNPFTATNRFLWCFDSKTNSHIAISHGSSTMYTQQPYWNLLKWYIYWHLTRVIWNTLISSYYSLVEYIQKIQNINYRAVTIKSDGNAERVNYAQVIQQMKTMLPPKVQSFFLHLVCYFKLFPNMK